MSRPPEDHLGRRTLLAPLMFVVLLASVGAAWLVTRQGRLGQMRGREILSQIRAKSLSHYWPDGLMDQWLLGTNRRGEVVGWQRITRQSLDGQHSGVTLRGMVDGTVSQESWTLNDRATAGEYSAVTSGRSTIEQMAISMTDGMVTVHPAPGATPRTAQMPDDYVPKGSRLLVAYLAAMGGEKASCRMIFDDEAVSSTGVNFTRIQLTPDGPDRVRLTAPGRGDTVYSFDRNGLVTALNIVADDIRYTPASAGEVAKHFRQVRNPISSTGADDPDHATDRLDDIGGEVSL